MAKTITKPDDENAEIALSLAEFCTRLSGTDKRVEMIGAFHADEQRAGRIKDVESAYLARFAEFINQPA